MCAVSHNENSAEFFLKLVFGTEHALFALNSLKNPVVVTDYACKVNGNNRLGVVVDCFLHLVVIHLKASAFAVNHNRLCAHVIDNRSGCSVGVGRKNNLISRSDSENTQSKLGAGGLRRKADSLVYVT